MHRLLQIRQRNNKKRECIYCGNEVRKLFDCVKLRVSFKDKRYDYEYDQKTMLELIGRRKHRKKKKKKISCKIATQDIVHCSVIKNIVTL